MKTKKEFFRISCTDAINTAKIAVIRITPVRNTLEYIRNGKKKRTKSNKYFPVFTSVAFLVIGSCKNG